MPFNAFLFDLDGTLIDEFDAIHRRYVYTLGRLGLPEPTLAQVRGAVGGGLEKGLAKFVDADRLPEALRIYHARWRETVLDGVRALPGAAELLSRLHARGARLGVITNKPGGPSREICRHLGWAPLLAVVLGAEDTAWLKPQPEFTRLALERLGATAEEALLVGDSPYDIQAARGAGVAAWCVATGTHGAGELQAAGAGRVFASLSALGSGLEAPGLR